MRRGYEWQRVVGAGVRNSNSNYYNPIWHRSQCCGIKWGARVLRVRSVSREGVWEYGEGMNGGRPSGLKSGEGKGGGGSSELECGGGISGGRPFELECGTRTRTNTTPYGTEASAAG